ncbi:hypothetical protein LIA77_01509 [Sarocladium implicatum]|nr:hypothetical protein LIA77_01509 [Sarocladium implicatum]
MAARGADPWPERRPRSDFRRLGFVERLDEPFDPMVAFAPVAPPRASDGAVGNALHTEGYYASYPMEFPPDTAVIVSTEATSRQYLPLGNPAIRGSSSSGLDKTRYFNHRDQDRKSQKFCPKCATPELPGPSAKGPSSVLAVCENASDESEKRCGSGPLCRVRQYAQSVCRSLKLAFRDSARFSSADDEENQAAKASAPPKEFAMEPTHDPGCPMAVKKTTIPNFIVERGHFHDV